MQIMIRFFFLLIVFGYSGLSWSDTGGNGFFSKKNLLSSRFSNFSLFKKKLSSGFHKLQYPFAKKFYKSKKSYNEDLIKKLSDRLDHPNPRVRERAVFQMINYIGPHTRLLNKRISLLLWDSDSDVRLVTLMALEMSGFTHWSMIKSFSKALSDSDQKVQIFALKSLSERITLLPLNDSNLSKSLIELTNSLKILVYSDNRYIRLTSADLYRQITGYSFLNTLNVEEDQKIQQLVKSLNSTVAQNRVEAVRALEPYIDRRVIHRMIRNMLLNSDNHKDVQIFATRVLGNKGALSNPLTAQVIGKNIMSSSELDLRMESIQAVMNQQILPLEVLQIALSTAVLYDTNQHVRRLAIRVLGKIYHSYKSIEDTVLYSLIKALSDPFEDNRLAVIYILEQKPTSNSEVLSALSRLATQDESSVVRNWSQLAFQKLNQALIDDKKSTSKADTCKKVFSS